MKFKWKFRLSVGMFIVITVVSSIFYIFKGSKRYNLLLITIDTLRADHVGCYGYEKAHTPNIDNLAKQGVLFYNAYSQAPLTFPSHTSILTGMNPTYHGIKDNSFFHIRSDLDTVASILKKNGYETGAVVSASTLSRDKGLDKGFLEYDDVPVSEGNIITNVLPERIASESVLKAQNQLLRFFDTKRPFFLWLHLFDPHANYNPPSPFKEKFPDSPYDGEIAYTDYWIGKLFSFLQTHEKMENTIIVIVADHGEGLWEHGEAGHGYFLYNTTLHVPLIFKIPGVKPQKINNIARSIDIMPTILSAMKIPYTKRVQGKDLSPLFYKQSESKNWSNTLSYGETYFAHHSFGWRRLISIIKENYKYIDTKDGMLYNLKLDPNEKNNLLANTSDTDDITKASELKQLLYEYIHKTSFRGYSFQKQNNKQLYSLPYLSFPSGNNNEDSDNLGFDPTEMVPVLKLYVQAQSMIANKNYVNAISLLNKIIEKDKTNIASFALLGQSYSRIGDLDKAMIAYKKFQKLCPHKLVAKKAILDILMQKQQYKRAEKLLQDIVKNDGVRDPIITSRLAFLKLENKEYQKAEKWAQKAILQNSKLPGSWYYLALARKLQKKFKDAVEPFERALLLRPRWPEAYYHYGICLSKVGRFSYAKKAFRKALEQADKNEVLICKIKEQLLKLSK